MARVSFILVLLFGLVGSVFGVFWLGLILIGARGEFIVTVVILLFLTQFVAVWLWLAAKLIEKAIHSPSVRDKIGRG
jgi:hypothetical protein